MQASHTYLFFTFFIFFIFLIFFIFFALSCLYVQTPPTPFAALKAISEPSVCRYQLVVCSPLMCEDKSEEQLEEERAAHIEHPGMGREQHKRLKSLPKNNTLSQVAVADVGSRGCNLHIHFLTLVFIFYSSMFNMMLWV